MDNTIEKGSDGLLRRRDSLLRRLRENGVSGIVSAGLSRDGREVGLTVFVRPGYKGTIPDSFEGVPVKIAPAARVFGF